MNRDDIITLPNQNLRQRSQRVGVINDETRRLIKDMKAATLDWEDHRKHEFGVALAAVQVDTLLRVVVIRNNFDDKSDRTFVALINPEIVKKEGDIIEDFEGCLSVKDLYGKVPRYERVKVKALDPNGEEFRIKAEGFLARVLQHEIDHTKGKLFIDHIKDKDEFYHLNDEGKLEKLEHAKVAKTNILW